jgi:hypothetical protein
MIRGSAFTPRAMPEPILKVLCVSTGGEIHNQLDDLQCAFDLLDLCLPGCHHPLVT